MILQFGVSVVLARLLDPSDFGLLAMAAAVTAMAGMFQSLGMHGPIIQREHVSFELIDTVFLTNLVLSALLTGVVMLSAPWVAELYRDDAVEPIIRVLALTLAMHALGGVPGALLRRRMRFPAIAKITVAAGALQATVALTLAINGFGVWSLVFATLGSAVAEAGLMLAAARYWPRLRFSLAALRSIAGFSVNITGVNALEVISRHVDKLIIGRGLGAEALGFYGMALRFTRQPVSMFVRPILGPVLFPAYSRMQHDDNVTAATMRRALAGVSLVIFPALTGFALVAEPFVLGLLGAKWAPAIYAMYAMAPVGVLRGLLVAVISVLVARDRTGVFFLLRLAHTAALVLAVVVGLQWGVVGVAVCILVAEACVCTLELEFCARGAGAGIASMLRGCVPVAGATAAMAAGVLLTRWGAAWLGWPHVLELVAAIAAGVLVYGVAVLLLRIPAASDMAGLMPDPAKRAIRRALGTA